MNWGSKEYIAEDGDSSRVGSGGSIVGISLNPMFEKHGSFVFDHVRGS